MSEMNIYSKKQQWKIWLVIAALVIVGISLWYTNTLVKKIARDERTKVKLWAEAIQNKAHLVKYTQDLFDKIKEDERKKVELWAKAMNKLLHEENSSDLTFYIDIISSNKSIPAILTDQNNIVSSSVNLNIPVENFKPLPKELKEKFSEYPPIKVEFGHKTLSYLYYSDSRLFEELQLVMNDLIKTFISEVVINSASSPVIITDSSKTNIVSFGNIDSLKMQDKVYIANMISRMSSQNKPIEVQLANNVKNYIYYEDSFLLTSLKYYPYILLGLIGLFLIIAYLAFSSARKAEQNQVWIGMARETAHQLGTPLSSLMAWLELLRSKSDSQTLYNDISKDIKRLETITNRFSKIGSEPKLEKTNLSMVLFDSVDYIKSRTSSKVIFNIETPDHDVYLLLNFHLFEWVIENLCKNAVDAMNGNGSIEIKIHDELRHIYIDITDTGKGVPKSKYKDIFKPGYTTKQRGWGLGLSLSKRIIENYHAGKIFVKQSQIGKGTTFRIVLSR